MAERFLVEIKTWEGELIKSFDFEFPMNGLALEALTLDIKDRLVTLNEAVTSLGEERTLALEDPIA